jgi:hypothetical protein
LTSACADNGTASARAAAQYVEIFTLSLSFALFFSTSSPVDLTNAELLENPQMPKFGRFGCADNLKI